MKKKMGYLKHSEIKFIDFFPELEYLDLYHNKITTIKGLNTWVNLEELNLSNNPITTIEGQIEEYELEYCKIEQYFQKLN